MKTPQEKKRLSYAKDRRNTFGENSKASRKGIPLAKARANRSERHAQDRLLSTTLTARTEDEMTTAELEVKGSEPRKWKKDPDTPLGQYLLRQASRRARRAA
jgi:hypothetical protein